MKKKILLVEDEPTIQKLLFFMLSKDFEIHVAANGYDAFLWLESQRMPDLIITDWMMPHMDGPTFLKCIRVSGLYSDIPVIILSSLESLPEEVGKLPHPVKGYFHKPFDPIALKETIGHVFNTSIYGLTN